MIAIVAAVFFVIALIMAFVGNVLGVLTADVFIILGLLCMALHLAGVGVGGRSFSRGRR